MYSFLDTNRLNVVDASIYNRNQWIENGWFRLENSCYRFPPSFVERFACSLINKTDLQIYLSIPLSFSTDNEMIDGTYLNNLPQEGNGILGRLHNKYCECLNEENCIVLSRGAQTICQSALEECVFKLLNNPVKLI